MHKATLPGLVLLSLVTTASLRAADPPRQSVESATEEITRLTTVEWPQAVARHDVRWFDSHFADELLMTNGQTGELTTKAQELASIDVSQVVDSTSKIVDLHVNVYGDTAVTAFQVDVSGTDETGPWNRIARYTEVWVRRDGRWQLVASHSNPVPELHCCPTRFTP